MSKIKGSGKGTRKETIIKAAAALFREKGYGAASMRDLAEKVGVEAASLYNHIRSKAEILQEICFGIANEFIVYMDEIENSQHTELEKVEKILRKHIQMMITRHERVYVTDHEWKHLPEPYYSNFHNQRRTYRKRFTAIIEKGIQKGEIKHIDAPTAVIILLQSVNGIESWHRSNHRISAAALEENMVSILIEGIKKN